MIAAERAADMFAAANQDPAATAKFWDDLGRRNLAALMHAAALGELTMVDVQQWVSDPDKHEPQIVSLLLGEPGAGVRDRGRAVHRHERPHPLVDHLDHLARAGVADPPAGAGRRAAGGQGGHPFDVATCSPTGPACTCSAGKRPRSRRWCAR